MFQNLRWSLVNLRKKILEGTGVKSQGRAAERVFASQGRAAERDLKGCMELRR